MHITVSKLKEICNFYNFPFFSQNEIGIVAFRGCVPVDSPELTHLSNTVEIKEANINYSTPRCTFIVVVGDQLMALLGSTVPHNSYIKKSISRKGQGTNQMFFGRYVDYKKGIHNAGPTGHQALRQTDEHPVRRSADDMDFENDDLLSIGIQYDNIHAGWNMGIDHAYYASAGCQVISGYPHCKKRNDNPSTGYWKCFENIVFATAQKDFTYILLPSSVLWRRNFDSNRIIFGSEGKNVMTLQEALNTHNKCHLKVDGNCGLSTFKEILKFQEKFFGPNADDGIVGPMTAKALGISL